MATKSRRIIDPATVPDAKVEFIRQCAALDERIDHAALPDISYAMEPDTVCFFDDVSNTEQFNDRYLEPRVEGEITFLMQVSTLGAPMSILIVFVMAPFFGEFHLSGVLICIPFFLIAWFFLYMGTAMAQTRVRFNRQAQLVHVTYGKAVVHVPWRDVRPYTEFGHDYRLRLCFPVPYVELMSQPDLDPERVRKRKLPFIVGGDFDAHDHLSLDGNLTRLEFIRRYMEHGLDAIQPKPEWVKEGLVDKPTGDNPVVRTGKLSDIFLIWDICFNLFSLKPLLDRWIKHKANSFRWPEEVERLCAPGADLSAYDTRPVKSSTRYFYRYVGMDKGVIFVDHRGRQVQPRSTAG
ncbi:hypothetical protein [Achromobacter kerstersii]